MEIQLLEERGRLWERVIVFGTWRTGSARSTKMLGHAKVAFLDVCSNSILQTHGKGALKPAVISHPKAGSGFKWHSERRVQILPMDTVAKFVFCWVKTSSCPWLCACSLPSAGACTAS